MDPSNTTTVIQSGVLDTRERDGTHQVALVTATSLAEPLLRLPSQSLPSLSRSSVISHWYSDNSAARSADEILSKAYDEARTLFSTELTQDECQRIWVQEKSSMSDVVEALAQSKLKYDNKPASKARKWLAVLSGRVVYYNTVLDVLVQQYPEYVSLAWGAMKFLFTVINNHEEKITQLAKAFSRIGEILPRTDLALILYPTDLMGDAIAHLYAKILKFVVQAVKWYKKNKFVHSFGAIGKPWALSFKDDVEDIAAQSRYIDELSSSASKAELRATHIDLLEAHTEVREARIEIRYIADLIKAKTVLLAQKPLASEVYRDQILPNPALDSETRSRAQITHLLSLLEIDRQPSPQVALSYCQSLLRRNRTQPHLPLSQISLLQQWATVPTSSLLLLDNSIRNLSKTLLMDLLKVLNLFDTPVIWVLRFPDFRDTELSSANILRMLLTQALQLNPSSISQHTTPATLARFNTASTDQDWLYLLNQAFTGLPRVFVAIDAELLAFAVGHSKYRVTRWLEMVLRSIKPTSLKIFIAASIVDENYMSRNWEAKTWLRVSARTDPKKSSSRRNRGQNITRLGRQMKSSMHAEWRVEQDLSE